MPQQGKTRSKNSNKNKTSLENRPLGSGGRVRAKTVEGKKHKLGTLTLKKNEKKTT